MEPSLEEQFKSNLISLLDELAANTASKEVVWKCSDRKEVLNPRFISTTIGNHTLAIGKKVSTFLWLVKEEYKMFYYPGSNFSLENDRLVKPLPVSNDTAKALFSIAADSVRNDYLTTTNKDLTELRKDLKGEP